MRDIAGLLDKNDFQEAMIQSDRFLSRHPRDTRAQILKARSLTGLNRHSSADYLLQQVALQSNGFPDDAAALRSWSVSLLHLEQWSRAESILETLAINFPDDPEILYPLTITQIRQKKYANALATAKRLSAIPDYDQQAAVMSGTIYHDQGNSRDAAAAWESILSTNPDASDLQIAPGEFFAMAGEDFLDAGSPAESARLLEKSAALLPSGRTFALLGRAYSQTEQQDKAIQSWEMAIEVERLNEIAREELANAALRNGDAAKALEWISPLQNSANLQSSTAYIFQRIYTQLKDSENTNRWRDRVTLLRDSEKVNSTINEMLAVSSSPYWTGFLRAYQLAHQHQWDEAQGIIDQLKAHSPDEPVLELLAAAVRTRGELPALDTLAKFKP